MAHRNTFAGNPLDRAGDLRNDADWLAEREADPEALAMVLWEGRPLVEETAEGPHLAWLSLKHARDMVTDRDLFLGLWNGAPTFAVEFEGSLDPAEGPVRGLGAFHEMRAAASLLPGPD
ncbi:MAG: NUDIX-like domain-containing protein, partial [Brevundimonas sp.]